MGLLKIGKSFSLVPHQSHHGRPLAPLHTEKRPPPCSVGNVLKNRGGFLSDGFSRRVKESMATDPIPQWPRGEAGRPKPPVRFALHLTTWPVGVGGAERYTNLSPSSCRATPCYEIGKTTTAWSETTLRVDRQMAASVSQYPEEYQCVAQTSYRVRQFLDQTS